jgi:predicted nucleic acid-binding protein
VKVFLDGNLWIEHLRHDSLEPLFPRIRKHYQLWMDALVAAELIAGCRSRIERRIVDVLIEPFAQTGRLRAAHTREITDAGVALARLRERGEELANGALVDAITAVAAAREGAVLVSDNARDFGRLARVLPLRWETLAAFTARL